LPISGAILDVLHYVRTGEPRDPEEPDGDLIPRPSELADCFKNAAEQIEVWTGLE
jgi:hypothetical protein